MRRLSRREQRDADAERDRQKRMTIDTPGDAARVMAALLAEVDREAARIEAGRGWAQQTMEELRRIRACALAALWRLPISAREWSAYPSEVRESSPGLILLSHVVRFQGACRPWAGDVASYKGTDPEDQRRVFVATVRDRKTGGRRYTYTPEELGARARRAASIARKWNVEAVYRAT